MPKRKHAIPPRLFLFVSMICMYIALGTMHLKSAVLDDTSHT